MIYQSLVVLPELVSTGLWDQTLATSCPTGEESKVRNKRKGMEWAIKKLCTDK